jgi:hypothetical protein
MHSQAQELDDGISNLSDRMRDSLSTLASVARSMNIEVSELGTHSQY